ncbi:MAG TPA: ABC transporter, partial [Mangrovimonas sp.]|nr:ABC transporter [Mangrovimonas sp.]
MKELQHLNKYFKKYKYKILLGIVITIVSKVFTMFTPRFINKIFKVVETHMGAETTDKSAFTSELLK